MAQVVERLAQGCSARPRKNTRKRGKVRGWTEKEVEFGGDYLLDSLDFGTCCRAHFG